MTKKKAAVVGFASSSRDLAPYDDPECAILALNELYRSIPRWDVLFEMHKIEYVRQFAPRDGATSEPSAHYTFLKSLPPAGDPAFRPVYMQQRHEDIPASVALPIKELSERFFPGEDPYFTSTPSYMIAMAIMEGYEEIGIYGIDLLQDEEYSYQRPGAEYLIGVARGMGIKVHVPKQSALCKANYLYGYTEPPDAGVFQPFKDFLTEQLNKHQAQFNQAEATRHTLNGVLQGVQACISWIDHQKRGGALGAGK
jgi:hypothetical protein